MRNYELVTVIRPDVTDEEALAIIEKVKSFITDRKGEPGQISPWGKRKLAYRIKQYKEGNYFYMNFRLEPKETKELETSLKLNEKVLRHLLVKKEKQLEGARGDAEQSTAHR
ncbi:MAG: 30S ribosomal protein S6 [Dehalococcoidia bacterium]|nr:30S ribosomal protein S6 [Dehalococcoidia bacterium]